MEFLQPYEPQTGPALTVFPFRDSRKLLKLLGFTRDPEMGRKALELFPMMDASFVRMLLEAERLGCVKEVAAVIAIISVGDIFFRPKENDRLREKERMMEARDVRIQLDEGMFSDAFIWLNAFRQYEAHRAGEGYRLCQRLFLKIRAMEESIRVRDSILSILVSKGMPVSSKYDGSLVSQSVASGLIPNVLWNCNTIADHCDMYSEYTPVIRTDLEKRVLIHPDSILADEDVEWIAPVLLYRTRAMFARGCIHVSKLWVESYSGMKITDEHLWSVVR